MTVPSEPRGILREARLSARALTTNLVALTRMRDPADVVVDLRADAYGHGLEQMAPHVLAHGIRRARLSPEAAPPAGLIGVDAPPHPDELLMYGFHSEPVLSLVGSVLALKRVAAGSGVSYGYSYRAPTDTNLALVGLGYADGVPRLGSNLAHVHVGGVRVLVAGRIAMDQFVTDLGENVVAVGDEVTVWGSSQDYSEWTVATVRTAQDLTAGLAPRVRRRWVET